MTDLKSYPIKLARAVRISTVRNLYKDGYIHMYEALELLRGELTPGDSSTTVDDSELLDLTPAKIMDIIFNSDEDENE